MLSAACGQRKADVRVCGVTRFFSSFSLRRALVAMALRLLGAAPWVVSSPRSAAQQQNALLLSGGFLVLRGDPETCEIGPNIKYMNIACTCTVTCFVVVIAHTRKGASARTDVAPVLACG